MHLRIKIWLVTILGACSLHALDKYSMKQRTDKPGYVYEVSSHGAIIGVCSFSNDSSQQKISFFDPQETVLVAEMVKGYDAAPQNGCWTCYNSITFKNSSDVILLTNQYSWDQDSWPHTIPIEVSIGRGTKSFKPSGYIPGLMVADFITIISAEGNKAAWALQTNTTEWELFIDSTVVTSEEQELIDPILLFFLVANRATNTFSFGSDFKNCLSFCRQHNVVFLKAFFGTLCGSIIVAGLIVAAMKYCKRRHSASYISI